MFSGVLFFFFQRNRCQRLFKVISLKENLDKTHVIRKAKVNLRTDKKLVSIHRAVISCIPLNKINFRIFGQEITCLPLKFSTT